MPTVKCETVRYINYTNISDSYDYYFIAHATIFVTML